MQERRAGAGEVLHAEEHAVLLRGGSHQQRFAVALAGLQRHAGIAPIRGSTAGSPDRLSDSSITTGLILAASCMLVFGFARRSRWVGCSMYCSRRMPREIARRLGPGKSSTYSTFGALLVEVGRVGPRRCSPVLAWASAATRSIDTTRSTSQSRSSPASLIFKWVSPSAAIHSAASPAGRRRCGCLNVGVGQRVERPDQVVQRHPGLWLAQRIGDQDTRRRTRR